MSYNYKHCVAILFAWLCLAGAAAAQSPEPAATLLSVRSIAINSATGKFYAAEPSHGTVAIFDPATRKTAHIKTGEEPLAIAVNSKTNRIYVVNHGSGTLTVIDGANDSALQTLNVGALPYVVAVNETTNRIYVSNVFSDAITMIDGATGETKKINAGSADTLTLDQTRDKVFLAGYQSTKLNVIDKTPAVIGNVVVGYHAWGIVVDEAAGTLYVTRVQDAALLIIDEATGATTSVPTGSIPCAVAVIPGKQRAYVVNHGSDSATIIDTEKRTVVATVHVGDAPQGIAVNPATGLVYVANNHSSSISVLDADTGATLKFLPTGKNPYNVVVDPATAHLYIALEGDPSFEILDLRTP